MIEGTDLAETENRIVIQVPVEKEYARLLRLVVSGIASRMDFNLDAIDDLKIAVEEGFLMAMRRRPSGSLEVTFEILEDRLDILFAGIGAHGPGGEAQSFGNFILEAVVDGMERVEVGGAKDLRLTKYL